MQQFSAETSEVQGLQSKISPVTQQPSSLVGADRGSPAAGPVTTEMHFWKPPPPQAWNPWALLSFLLSPWEHQQKQHSSQLLRPMFSTYCTEHLAATVLRAPQKVLPEKDQAYLLALDLLREKHLHPSVERNCKTGCDGWLKYGFNSQLYNLGTTQTFKNKFSILTPKQPAVLLLVHLVHLWFSLCYRSLIASANKCRFAYKDAPIERKAFAKSAGFGWGKGNNAGTCDQITPFKHNSGSFSTVGRC